MSSERKPSRLNFDRDLPTTPEDVQALRENRPKAGENWLEQLTKLSEQIPNIEEVRQKRRTFKGWEPFEL